MKRLKQSVLSFSNPKRDEREPDGGENESDHPSTSSTSGASALAETERRTEVSQLPSDIHKNEITRPLLKTYPSDKNSRRFRLDWYEKYKWLEYSVERDAAFCFVCRQFSHLVQSEFQLHKENAFTSVGFKSWKTALGDKKKGFEKHDSSIVHIDCMRLWQEKNDRSQNKTSISTQLGEHTLSKHRYYVTSVAGVIQFLALHELPFRGDSTNNECMGLFNSLFSYTIRKDPILAEIVEIIPRNSRYTSPSIQNDVILTMANIISTSVADEVKTADVQSYSILVDGTRDKANVENIAIALRYVRDGKVIESLLKIPQTDHLDAEALTDTILSTLSEYGLSSDKIISQCYDGASCMSGIRGGVQAILQTRLGHVVPYVHCYNHRLHLVIVDVVSAIPSLNQFFGKCTSLYAFFRKPTVSRIYEGSALKRLIDTRWTGHLSCIQAIKYNFKEIVKALEEVESSCDFNGDIVVLAGGLSKMVKSFSFCFFLSSVTSLLETLSPLDKNLQSRVQELSSAKILVTSTKEEILSMRVDSQFQNHVSKATDFSTIFSEKLNIDERAPKRKRMCSSQLADFLVLESVGYQEIDKESVLKPIYFEMIDVIVSEFERRFEENSWFFQLLEGVILSSDNFLDHTILSEGYRLRLAIPSQAELNVVKGFLSRSPGVTQETLLSTLFAQRAAFKETYEFVAALASVPCSTAVCEASFSSLTRIDQPQRRSMSSDRKGALSLLAFESERTKQMDMNLVLKEFSKLHTRLRLF